jgi:hypothetical protein
MDANETASVGQQPNGSGWVNCQFGAGEFERFFTVQVDDVDDVSTFAIISAAWGAVLRMDGNTGVVNCQASIGKFEKFALNPQMDGTFLIESIEFPNHFLHLDGCSGVTSFNPNGIGTAHCRAGTFGAARVILEPV